MSTIEQLTQLLHDKFDIDKSSLQPDLPLPEYGLDSLALAELLFTIEEEFDIKFPDRPENINTLRELSTAIDDLRLSQQA
ncbi:acyl carrier protein [Massilia sp. TW-1]|uniref:Acyl carrier protein n=1 Tax=Telluria antibiotica TaxID=2717319 RepID=A0ABX0P8P4_9BURK|nr:acyl carrier protein [Telluria antibiotica]NIA53028.1 acyl carrier protein [Telluria antibiotica]